MFPPIGLNWFTGYRESEVVPVLALLYRLMKMITHALYYFLVGSGELGEALSWGLGYLQVN